MEKLFIIISGRIYKDLLDLHIKSILQLKEIFSKKYDITIGLFLWDNCKEYVDNFKDIVNILEFYDEKKYSNIGYLKMFKLQKTILEKHNNYNYFLRIRTDIFLKDFNFYLNLSRYNSFKWARGISDNIGFARKNIFLKIWTTYDENRLKSSGPEIYLKKITRENNFKLHQLKTKIILFKSLTEKRKPGMRIWNSYDNSYKYINNINLDNV